MNDTNTDDKSGVVEEDAKKSAAEREEAKSMCRHGFHDWVTTTEDQEGGVETVKCRLCGKEKPDDGEQR